MSSFNAVKLYFFIFLLIFLVRAGLKWRDTDIMPLPEVTVQVVTNNGNVSVQTNTLNTEELPLRIPFVIYLFLIAVDLMALIGIFGYAFSKQIFFPLFWRIFLFLFILAEGYLIYTTTFRDSFLVFLYSLVLILPAPYTIYLYGFKYRWVDNLPGQKPEEDEDDSTEE